MATAAPTHTKNGANKAKKVARSAITGRFVLAPATKRGKVTIIKARAAANAVHSSKK